ncbi:hypothetical protein EV714DRAFT_278167 [Schizophyllum commune]
MHIQICIRSLPTSIPTPWPRRRRLRRGSSSSPRRSDRVDGYIGIERARRRRRRARTRPGEHHSHDLPDAHHPNPFALPSSPQTTPRSLPEVDARRNTWPQFRRYREHFALLGPQLPTYPVPHATTPPTNVSVRDGDMRDALPRSSTLTPMTVSIPVRAPSTTSKNDAGTHSFPPTTMVPYALLRRDTTPRSSSDAVAVVPRIEFPASLTSQCAVFSRDPEPPEARVRTPRTREAMVKCHFIPPPPFAQALRQLGSGTQRGSEGGLYYKLHGTSRTTVFSQILEPPEARAGSRGEILAIPNRRRPARAPSAKNAEGVGYPYPRAGLDGGAAAPLAPDSTPDRQRHVRGPLTKDAAGVGAPYLLVMNM